MNEDKGGKMNVKQSNYKFQVSRFIDMAKSANTYLKKLNVKLIILLLHHIFLQA